MGKLENVIPEGSPRARIRASRKHCRNLQETEISDTLGEDMQGMVVVDSGGHPMKYDSLTIILG